MRARGCACTSHIGRRLSVCECGALKLEFQERSWNTSIDVKFAHLHRCLIMFALFDWGTRRKVVLTINVVDHPLLDLQLKVHVGTLTDRVSEV